MSLTEILLPALLPAVALIGVLVSLYRWGAERRDRREEGRLERKYEAYAVLSELARAVLESPDDRTMRDRLLSGLRACWLYAGDEVIDTGHAFLDDVASGGRDSYRAFTTFLLTMRVDMQIRTRLEFKDWTTPVGSN
ncbi:MAG: hypothetical protein OXL97_08980 [Chloroflexota bacterium]|nr:hypothetical protein [Chloroflexota bacterium]MDE2883473.1 hypothetical protein [Chloroflexota bacterium]